MQRSLLHAIGLTAVLLAACGGGSDSSTSASTDTAAAASDARTAQSLTQRLAVAGGAGEAVIDARLLRARGDVDVWVSLSDPSVAAYKSARLEAQGVDVQRRAALSGSARETLSAAESSMTSDVRLHRDALRARQNELMNQLGGFGARELGRVVVAHNAVAVKVNAASLRQIAQLPGVSKLRPVINYQLALAETVPYVGAAAAQAAGKDGTGVRVAVIDSGVDYTHYNLGGAGTAAAYAAAYGADPSDPKNTTRDGLFPTAKVVDGFDFVGDAWPNGPRTEDPDPIDFQGHGTHVADIIAGHSADGLHKGVAPGASLVAIKVCSSVATSCNGISLLKAMDFALDPNDDGDTSDAVDVIN
uniref:S8 family serine peptidase n=1 Tax=Piscinibacter sp. TaxID=1903157 RepID=UPI00355A688A